MHPAPARPAICPTNVAKRLALLALLLTLAALAALPAARPADAGSESSLPLTPGGQFIFWSLPDTTAAQVFSTVKIAWLFDNNSVTWTSFVPALGLVDFPLTPGAVLWIVSDSAQTISLGPSSDDAPPTLTLSNEALDFADNVVATVGEDQAIIALILALERGYSLEQLEAGAANGELNADGIIVGSDPDGPPLGIFEIPAASVLLQARTTNPLVTAGNDLIPASAGVDLFQNLVKPAFEEQQEPDDGAPHVQRVLEILASLIELRNSGYTVEQIVTEAVLVGSISVVPGEDTNCAGLRDSEGEIVLPQGSDLVSKCQRAIINRANSEAPIKTDEQIDKLKLDELLELSERIQDRGTVSASSTFMNDEENYGANLAFDGSEQTSWFSSGPGPDGTSVFTWTATQDLDILWVSVVSNRLHAEAEFRSGFGFAELEVRLLDAGGIPVASQTVEAIGGQVGFPSIAFPRSPTARTVQLVFRGHENPTCGGFAELRIQGFVPE